MAGSTQVLILGRTEDEAPSALSQTLRSKGFIAADAPLSSGDLVLEGDLRPDILVFNLVEQEAERNVDEFVEFARRLKDSELTEKLPIIAVDSSEHGDGTVGGALRGSLVSDVLAGPLNEVQLVARVNSLVRLNTMHEELVRRLNTSAKYGVDAPDIATPPTSVEDATVLVIGATASFPVIESVLSPHAALVGALTNATALDYLSRRTFDCVIVDVDKNADTYIELCQEIRRNTRLYNLPVVLLAPLGVLNDPEELFSLGVSDVVAKPLDAHNLEARVMALIRELRFRDSMRAIYKQARHMATSDGLTGLYSRGFFLEHLGNVIEDCRARGRGFSLAYLSICNLERINQDHGFIFGDRIIRQVGEMMGFLVRGEDLTARYGGGNFCIILPDTVPEQARVALQRITGVVRTTELAPQDGASPVTVDLIASVVGYDGTSTPEQLVEQARARFS